MNPVFKEYCKFLKDTVNLELEEGYYWLDNQIIKAFDKQGIIHKLYRIVVDNNLSISYRIPYNYETIEDFELASWRDIIEMNCFHLEKIESEAKGIICKKMNKFEGYIPVVPISMGKDSQVTCHCLLYTSDAADD